MMNENGAAGTMSDLPHSRRVEEQNNASNSLHNLFLGLIAVLSGFLQLKHHSTNGSPFNTHYYTMIGFFVVICVHAALRIVDLKLEASAFWKIIIREFSHLLGALGAIVLIYVINTIIGVIIFTVWVLWLGGMIYFLYVIIMDDSEEKKTNPSTA